MCYAFIPFDCGDHEPKRKPGYRGVPCDVCAVCGRTILSEEAEAGTGMTRDELARAMLNLGAERFAIPSRVNALCRNLLSQGNILDIIPRGDCEVWLDKFDTMCFDKETYR